MLDQEKKEYLMPGDLVFGCRSGSLHTLLGSCVAITLWHPTKKMGAMCHYMLPSRPKGPSDKLSGRYGDEAIKIFVAEIERHGYKPQEFEVNVFGAGTMIKQINHACKSVESPSIVCSHQCRNVACKNREAALQLLEKYGFHIRYVDVGGTHFRQLALNTVNGRVSVNGESIVEPSLPVCAAG